jgi:endonuclease/exonuclease/phosphatase family metal-dependent hydrolase
VRWVVPAGERDRARLLRWCVPVGPLVFYPDPAQNDPPVGSARSQGEGGHYRDQPIDRLAILTWNLHVGGGDIDDVVRRLRRGEFTGGDPVDQFVLLLQEAYRRDIDVPARIPRGSPAPRRIATGSSERGRDIRRFSREDGLAVLYAPSMRNGIESSDSEDRGNAIVSTLTLHQPVVVELPLERQRRVAVIAEVDGWTRTGSPWRLRVADAHLDTALALAHGGPFAARRRQASALVSALSESSTATVATVLAGDFNAWLGEREPALELLRRAFPETPQGADKPTWVGPLGIHARLDHVFVRGAAASSRVQRLPGRFGSDHYPLLTIVSFLEAGDLGTWGLGTGGLGWSAKAFSRANATELRSAFPATRAARAGPRARRWRARPNADVDR